MYLTDTQIEAQPARRKKRRRSSSSSGSENIRETREKVHEKCFLISTASGSGNQTTRTATATATATVTATATSAAAAKVSNKIFNVFAWACCLLASAFCLGALLKSPRNSPTYPQPMLPPPLLTSLCSAPAPADGQKRPLIFSEVSQHFFLPFISFFSPWLIRNFPSAVLLGKR